MLSPEASSEDQTIKCTKKTGVVIMNEGYDGAETQGKVAF